MVFKTILQHIYSYYSFVNFKKKKINNIEILFEYKNKIKLICTDGYKRYDYFLLTSFMIDYKKQVLIISIKINM